MQLKIKKWKLFFVSLKMNGAPLSSETPSVFIFGTNPTCSLWFPIASHVGKAIASISSDNYICKLFKKSTTYHIYTA